MKRSGLGPAPPRPGSRTRLRVWSVRNGEWRERGDELATEEPLEVRLKAGGEVRPFGVTMRTPGADFELAAGLLYAEGIVGGAGEIPRITYCTDPELDGAQNYNVVNVELAADRLPELSALDRHFHTGSACGVCGKSSLEALRTRPRPPLGDGPLVDAATLCSLPDRLRASQKLFDATGGLHAAALFSSAGELVCVREDVGRHNAVDKVVGWSLLNGGISLADHLLMVSGRSSFEIVQKAVVAGLPIVCAVSAPSSLAVSLAREFGVTLIGFLRGDRFNVYAGEGRIRKQSAPGLPDPE